MKIAFRPLLAIVGLLAQFQLVALGQDLNPSAVKSEPVVPEGAQAAPQSQSVDGQRRKAPASAQRIALDEVRDAVQADPTKAPGIVQDAIKTDVPHPVVLTCEIVRVAITAIDKKLTNTLVARVVYAAVKERPNEALGIVGVAIQETPSTFHLDIVRAAIAAVPDPYAKVSRASLESEPCSRPATRSDTTVQYDGIPLSDALYQEALLNGATAYDLDYFPVLGATGLANDDRINKDPPAPPPTPPPVSP